MGNAHGSELANLCLKVIRESQGRCTGDIWDEFLNDRIKKVRKQLKRNGASPEEIDEWYRSLVTTYHMVLDEVQTFVESEVFARAEPAGRA